MCNKISTGVVLLACLLVLPLPVGAKDDVFKIKTVVIDAGHGGHDPGAVGGGLREKDITLDVAVNLGKRIRDSFPDIKVIFTRDRDVYVPLGERSAIANRNKADLFISVHVNSVGGKRSISGTETFIMGTDKSASNMEVCKTENSVILLEDDYSTKYAGYDPDAPDSFIFFNLMQNAQFEQSIDLASFIENRMSSGPVGHSRGIKQAPLLVLWKTTMPSVLAEIGFISSERDRKILADKKSRDRIAGCIFNGFSEYKEKYEVEELPAEKPVEVPPAAKPDSVGERWGIQVFVLSKPISGNSPQMKGEKLEYLQTGGSYKYYVGGYESKFEAAADLARVRSKFKDAFIVRIL